jgi:hypothetical protein
MNIKKYTRERVQKSKIPHQLHNDTKPEEILLDAFHFDRVLHEHLRSKGTLIRAQKFGANKSRKCIFVDGKLKFRHKEEA